MNDLGWLHLQRFAGEGAGNGGGDGAGTGDAAAAAGQTGNPAPMSAEEAREKRLLELGVPAEKIRKRAKKPAAALPEGAVKTASQSPAQAPQQAEEQDAAAAAPTEETGAEKPARMSWEEVKADPEYNRHMQEMVQSRLRSAKAAEENLSKVMPALELLARQHGLDPANLDYDALNQAISDDDKLYEDKALELGVSTETAKKIDQQERQTARQQREQERTLQQQMFDQHIQSLEQQGEALKQVFPSFDLKKELQNKAFARMTAPGVGISVEDAYYAVHRKEIQAASMQVTAQKMAQKLSNAIQSGSRRPAEAGTTGQAPSVTTFDYRNATKEQRAALKRAIHEAKARGEKLYPGSYRG